MITKPGTAELLQTKNESEVSGEEVNFLVQNVKLKQYLHFFTN